MKIKILMVRQHRIIQGMSIRLLIKSEPRMSMLMKLLLMMVAVMHSRMIRRMTLKLWKVSRMKIMALIAMMMITMRRKMMF